MANGRQLGEQHLTRFKQWVSEQSDDEFRALVTRSTLARKPMADACGFLRGVFATNPEVQKELNLLEERLRARGILPPRVESDATVKAPPTRRQAGTAHHAQASGEADEALKQECANLRAENDELRTAIGKHAVLHEALMLTGRLPR